MSPPFNRVHLIGIGGVGMSALANLLAEMGTDVSGSDRYLDQTGSAAVFDRLRAAGVKLFPQDGSGVDPACSTVAVSTAIEPGNPDLEAAQRLGIPVLHRSEILQELVRDRRSIAVTGTAGKTTVTAMLGWIFECAGRDPTVLNGGSLLDWISDRRIGSSRLGASDWWIFEADESDRSCLRYTPEWAIITNVSKDHFELSETIVVFRQFADQVRATILAGERAATTIQRERCHGVSFYAGEPKLTPDGASFHYSGVLFTTRLPGHHNAENALLAVAMAVETGIPAEIVADALASFRGVARRLDRVSAPGAEIPVFDDMAHNPAKIRAAWTALSPQGGSVIGVWRPHGFAPLNLLFDDLIAVFQDLLTPPGHRLFLLPVYYAGGTAKVTRTSADLAEALRALGCPAEAVEDEATLESRVAATVVPGATVLIMGARDPGLPALARRLAERLSTGTAR